MSNRYVLVLLELFTESISQLTHDQLKAKEVCDRFLDCSEDGSYKGNPVVVQIIVTGGSI